MKASPIFVKTYDFTKWLLEHTIKFPKSQRFVMAKRIEDAVLNFYDLLLLAVKETKHADTYGLRREIFGRIGFCRTEKKCL